MVKELCWICNFNDANSNEHMFKKSDIKQHTGFSKISKMFRSINFGRKFPIQGIKSKDFCFQTQICTHCNNSATQPYDRAWEILSAYLYDNFETLKSKGFFNPVDVFPENTDLMMRRVHLYFCKFIGCYFKDGNLPINNKINFKLSDLSNSLIHEKNNPLIFLNFGYNTRIRKDMVHMQSNDIYVEIHKANNLPIRASTFYSVGRVVVGVAYRDTGNYLLDWWNPLGSHNSILFNNLTKYIPSIK